MVFKQAVGVKRKFTAISEELYENCVDDTEFHLIICMGVQVLDEARAWRLRKKLKPKKGEFKELNPRTFKDLAIQFGLAPTTVNQNYNEAIKYHKLRKCKKSKKTDKSADPEGDQEEQIERSETSEEFSDEEVEVQGEIIAEAGAEMPKLPLVPKSEPTEQTPLPASE